MAKKAKAKATKLSVRINSSATVNYDAHRSSLTIIVDRPEDEHEFINLFAGSMLEVKVTANPSKVADVDGQQTIGGGKEADIVTTIACTCGSVAFKPEEASANLKFVTTDVDMNSVSRIYGKSAVIEVKRIGDASPAKDEEQGE